MKKTKNVVVLVVLALALVTFCACGLLANATGIEITSYPKTSYTTADTDFDWTGFKLKITYSGTKEPETLTYEELKAKAGKSFNVSNFNRSVGTHTATITYQKLEVTFQYTVAAGTFAGGEGTKANPYQISTVEQWENMINHAYDNLTYFVLVNDIDMANYNKNNDYTWVANVSIDGQGYALRNITKTLISGFGSYLGQEVYDNSFWDNRSKYVDEFKNVNLFIDYEDDSHIFYALTGAKMDISNVNIYGVYQGTAANNLSIFTGYPNSAELNMTKVKVYADFITMSARSAIFFGNASYAKDANGTALDVTINMTDCGYYGYAEAERVGLIYGNSNAQNANVTISLNNVKNYGKLAGTSYTAVFCTSDSKDSLTSIKKITVDGKVITKNSEITGVTGYETRKLEGLKFVYDTNKVLTVECENTDAVKFVITVFNWNDAYYDSERKNLMGTTGVTLYTTTVNRGTDGIEQPMINGEALKFLDWSYTDTAITGIELKESVYCINYFFEPYYMGKTAEFIMKAAGAGQARNKANYRVLAYDANGKLLGVAYAQASE